jgi:hypothetical protein
MVVSFRTVYGDSSPVECEGHVVPLAVELVFPRDILMNVPLQWSLSLTLESTDRVASHPWSLRSAVAHQRVALSAYPPVYHGSMVY